MKTTILLATAIAFASQTFAQTGDAPPVDPAQLLLALKQLREVNENGLKTRRNQAYAQILSASATAEKAVAFWKQAVKAVQFEGAKHEGAAMHD